MVGNYKVITLYGSTKFKEQYLEAQKRLTLEGNIVISVGLFGHSGDDEVWTEGTKAMLDDMHKRKIDMADEATSGLGARLSSGKTPDLRTKCRNPMLVRENTGFYGRLKETCSNQPFGGAKTKRKIANP